MLCGHELLLNSTVIWSNYFLVYNLLLLYSKKCKLLNMFWVFFYDSLFIFSIFLAKLLYFTFWSLPKAYILVIKLEPWMHYIQSCFLFLFFPKLLNMLSFYPHFNVSWTLKLLLKFDWYEWKDKLSVYVFWWI